MRSRGAMAASNHLGLLREPAAAVTVAVDAHVLARLEHDLEVAAIDRLVGPPAVDDAPLLTDDDDPLAVDDTRRSVHSRLDESGARSVEAAGGRASQRVRTAGPGPAGGGHVGCLHAHCRVTCRVEQRAPALPGCATTVPPPPPRTRNRSRCSHAPGAGLHAGALRSSAPSGSTSASWLPT